MDVRCLPIGLIDMHQSDLQCVPADRCWSSVLNLCVPMPKRFHT
jgi:hypothetical protein